MAAAFATANVLAYGSEAHAVVDPPPSIIIVLTDDQRADTRSAMPIVQQQLADPGIRFPNAFVTNPLCCPSRASLLTGTYSHTNGVWGNNPPLGGFSTFDDSSTVATWLDDAGYETGFFGQYLIGYGNNTEYVPPGWDRWLAFGEPGYDQFSLSDQGTSISPQGEYSTTFLGKEVASFIELAPSGTPLFALFAPFAPHNPTEPAAEDRNSFESLPPWRPPSYNERNVGDKPSWVADLPTISRVDQRREDRHRQRQHETLLAVDREIDRIVAALQSANRLHDTMIIFTSDNGYMWGEHRLFGKNVPYDPAVRVPFMFRYDALTSGGASSALVLNIDIAPTVADAAGVAAPSTDGESLLPLIQGTSQHLRHRFIVEHADGGTAPAFCAVRTAESLFVRYSGGEEEFYNYVRDPHELESRPGAPRAARSRRYARRHCQPEPPGFDW